MHGLSFSSDYFKSNRLENTRVGTESLEPLDLLHAAVTPGTLVCQALKHIQRLLAIDITRVAPVAFGALEMSHKPNSRSTFS